MITIVRHKRIYGITVDGSVDRENVIPAGEVFYFNGKNEVKEACNFMWGRDIKSYLIFRNGFDVKLDSELSVLEERLNLYG